MSDQTDRETYTTDLSDAEWERLKNHLPMPSYLGRPRKYARREIMNAIFYILRSGCAWRLLPHDFPPWESVYYYFRKWCDVGLFEQLNRILRVYLRRLAGRAAAASAAIIDSQSIKTTDVPGPRGYDAGKNVKGRKRHILVDTMGLLMLVIVHAANIQDYKGGRTLLEKAKGRFLRLCLIWTDGIYAHDSFPEWVRESIGWLIEIVTKPTDVDGFQVLPRRWVVERTFAWLGRYRRLSKDYEGLPASSEAFIYAAMTHIMVRRLAA